MPYDVILGRNALQQLGITLDFKNSVIKWNNTSVEMKEPTFLNRKSNLINLAYDDKPLHCAESSERAERILNLTSPKADLATIAAGQKNLTRDQKQALHKLLLEYEDLFDGSIGDWKTDPISLEL